MSCVPEATPASQRFAATLPPAFFHLDPDAAAAPMFAAMNRTEIAAWQAAIAAKQYCSNRLGGQGRFHAKILAAPPGKRRCSVVGSSATLLDSALGEQIDAADFVIRVNSAPTAGHGRDVGSLASLRVVTVPFR